MSIEKIKKRIAKLKTIFPEKVGSGPMIIALEQLLKAKEENESLKCCGNCIHLYNHGDCEDKDGCNSCKKWEFDNLTKEQREI